LFADFIEIQPVKEGSEAARHGQTDEHAHPEPGFKRSHTAVRQSLTTTKSE
jgi:hypothetical protein